MAGTHRAKHSGPRGMGPRLRGDDIEFVAASQSSFPLQYQIAISVDAATPARRDHRGGVELFDDRRSSHDHTDVEPVALVECGLDRGRCTEMNSARAFQRDLAGVGHLRRRFHARLVYWHSHAHTKAIAHYL